MRLLKENLRADTMKASVKRMRGRGLAWNEAEVAAGGETGGPFICVVEVCIC